MKKITTIGRILFAIPFALFGINHFLMTDYYLGMLTSFIPLGVPAKYIKLKNMKMTKIIHFQADFF
jgi:uncharacterized membrane protein